jgi:repressor LexA
MRDEGIFDGDFVLVERTEVAKNGDRVVALLPDGQTTLKRFYKEDDHIRLQPANPEFDPIRVKFCQVQGIVKGVVRRYN